MSEKIKLIIEMPKWEYEQACKIADSYFYAIQVKAIQNGIPLDDVKAEITTYKDNKTIHAERNEMIDIVLDIIDKYVRGEL